MLLTKRTAIIAALCVALATACASPSAPIPLQITAAVASPFRPASDIARDPTQRPAEVLAFAGVRPGDRVADFWPAPPYSTGLLSGAVGPTGKVFAVVPAKLIAEVPSAETDVRGWLAPFAPNNNIELLIQSFDAFAPPEQLDLIWLGKIYHDFPNPVEFAGFDIDAANRAMFNALKPGGVLIIVDHAASRGSKFEDIEPDQKKRLHRIDPDLVKAQVMAAGFEFVAESPLLANPDDDHAKSVFDTSIRDHTDRFVLKFRKPAH